MTFSKLVGDIKTWLKSSREGAPTQFLKDQRQMAPDQFGSLSYGAKGLVEPIQEGKPPCFKRLKDCKWDDVF